MENTRQKKEDRRVRYTKKAVREGFLRLLQEKPIERISVTEICREADINRGTFYAHYSDPYDLRRSLVAELTEVMQARVREEGVRRLSTVQSLTLLRENKELCQIFAGPYGDQDSMLKIVGEHADAYLEQAELSTQHMSPQMYGCIKMLLISSISTVFKYWLDNGMDADPETVAQIIDIYCSRGVKGFLA